MATETLDILVDPSQIEGLTAALGRLERSLEGNERAGDRSSRALDKQGRSADKTERESDQLQKSLDRLKNSTDRLTRAGENVSGSFTKAAQAFKGGGAVIGLATAAIVTAVAAARVAFRELNEAVQEGIERNSEAKEAVEGVRAQYEEYRKGLADGIVSSNGFARAVGAVSGLLNGLAKAFGDSNEAGEGLGDYLGDFFVKALQTVVDLVASAKQGFDVVVFAVNSLFNALKGLANFLIAVMFRRLQQIQTIGAGIAATFAALVEQSARIARAAPGMGSLASSLEGVASGARDSAEGLRLAAENSATMVDELTTAGLDSFSQIAEDAGELPEQIRRSSRWADRLNESIRSAAEGARSFEAPSIGRGGGGGQPDPTLDATLQQIEEARSGLWDAVGAAEAEALRQFEILQAKAIEEAIALKELEEQKLAFQLSLANAKPEDVLDKAAISARAAREEIESLAASVNNTLVTSVTELGAVFGEALGSGNFEDLLANSGKFLGSLLADLGKAAIATGAVISFGDPASGFLPNPARGAALIAAGTAAVVAGSALGAASSGGTQGSPGGSSTRPADSASSGGAGSNTVNVNNTFGIVGDPRATARMIGDQVRTGGRTGAVRPA